MIRAKYVGLLYSCPHLNCWSNNDLVAVHAHFWVETSLYSTPWWTQNTHWVVKLRETRKDSCVVFYGFACVSKRSLVQPRKENTTRFTGDSLRKLVHLKVWIQIRLLGSWLRPEYRRMKALFYVCILHFWLLTIFSASSRLSRSRNFRRLTIERIQRKSLFGGRLIFGISTKALQHNRMRKAQIIFAFHFLTTGAFASSMTF